MSRRTPEILYQICGQFHGTAAHVSGARRAYSSLNAANSNVPVQQEPETRKRLTAREAMALTKGRYKETLDYLA